MRAAARRMRRRWSCCSGELGSAGDLTPAILGTSTPYAFNIDSTLPRPDDLTGHLIPVSGMAMCGTSRRALAFDRMEPKDIGQEWDEHVDVVVAGSGAGAMTGALTAAANGLRTVVLEKTALLGGTSAYSGAAVWLPGTRVQERAGLGDSTESARAYLRALLGDDTEAHREAFLGTASQVVEFLERDPAIAFKFRPFPDYYDAPGRMDRGRAFIPVDLPLDEIGTDLAALVRPIVDRDRAGLGHAEDEPLTTGRALIGRLLLAYTRTGNGVVRTGTALTGLVRAADGRVTGVTATTTGGRSLRI